MATMAGLRSRVRTRLEEVVAAVWSDAELDECVTGALEKYAGQFPIEVITTAIVADGATTTTSPAGLRGIQRVLLVNGAVVPRRRGPNGATAGEAQSWEVYAGLIHFSQPLNAQTLTIWHSASATIDDLPVDDEGLIVLGAVAQALEARAIQDFKRGGPFSTSSDGVIAFARDEYERALARRSRRMRSGAVAIS